MIFVAIAMLVSFLLGGFPTAYVVARVTKGIDIRQHGSGNVGATNTLRAVGKIPGLIVLLGDIAKGIIAVTLVASVAMRMSAGVSPDRMRAWCGGMVVAGHIFNVFMGGRGGKGVATSAGVLIMLSPLALGIGAVVFIAVVAVTGYVSLGSILASVVLPFAVLLTGEPASYVALSAVLSILVVAKHKANIQRLLTGRESKLTRPR